MTEVVIVGAGPSGLCTAILLAQRGFEVKVFEQRRGITGHSRAIGIHPPGLAVLDEAGVGGKVAAEGVQISRGVGISRGRVIGELDFSRIPGPHNFIVSLPQNETLRLLRERLEAVAPGALVEGVRYIGHRMGDGGEPVIVQTEHGEPAEGNEEWPARWLIGADGVDSAVREQLGVPFRGRALPDGYAMGDFPETTEFGSTAVLFMHHHGIVESFPMPGNLRRWVAHTGTAAARAVDLTRMVRARTGHDLDPGSQLMYSQFTTSNRQAAAMVHGPVLLVGDAAHEVSPIGGQGMTLGLLDAAQLAQILQAAPEVQRRLWPGFERRRFAAARLAARQAHLNMLLGRPLPKVVVSPRDSLIGALAGNRRFSSAVARTFSMTNQRLR